MLAAISGRHFINYIIINLFFFNRVLRFFRINQFELMLLPVEISLRTLINFCASSTEITQGLSNGHHGDYKFSLTFWSPMPNLYRFIYGNKCLNDCPKLEP